MITVIIASQLPNAFEVRVKWEADDELHAAQILANASQRESWWLCKDEQQRIIWIFRPIPKSNVYEIYFLNSMCVMLIQHRGTLPVRFMQRWNIYNTESLIVTIMNMKNNNNNQKMHTAHADNNHWTFSKSDDGTQKQKKKKKRQARRCQ